MILLIRQIRLCEAASALKKQGATHVVAYATHAIFSGDAIESIDASELDEIVITDTITLRQNLKKSEKKLGKYQSQKLWQRPLGVLVMRTP